jgi:hypothetical protein
MSCLSDHTADQWQVFRGTCLLMLVFLCDRAATADDADTDFFEKRIRPVLIKHCYECHSLKSDELQGELRLDRRLTKSAPLIQPGKPDESRLIAAIRYTDSDLQMPPSGRLPAHVIADFEKWVRDGAVDPRPEDTSDPTGSRAPDRQIDLEAGRQFWAFQPVRRSPPPDINDDWIQSPIDAFILHRLQTAGLRPAERADRRALIRRASFVLIGLPPTPEEIDAFLADQQPQAFARLVDRLLASPDYAERWGRHWLDVVRYGDCNGADESRAFPNAWHFRNYIIDTFNRDLPYDRMIAEHLAGDLLEHDGEGAYEPLVGTGFLVLGTKILAEQDQVKMDVDIIDEQIDAFSRSMLAMTLACARCHDHKFDPLPTADYYSLAGIFQSTRTMAGYGKWLERPTYMRTSLAEAKRQQQELADSKAELAKLREKVEVALRRADAIELEAESFTRGNVAIETTNYGKGIGIIGDTGVRRLNFAEYDIEIETAGRYVLQFRYAAKTARPGRILLAGKVVRDPAISQISGDWHPPGQRWFFEGVHALKQGVNTFRVESKPLMSHIDKLRLIRIEGMPALADQFERVDAVAKQVSKLESQIETPIQVMAVEEGDVTNTRIHVRGSHLRLGDEVPRRFLQVIAGTKQTPLPDKQSGRLQLAEWMTQPDHPLTSRVMVNRLWRWHFGRGIVATPDNFGLKGERPTHPELLDWLARRFIERDWSIKAMHRELMRSSTWQMSSTSRPEQAQRSSGDSGRSGDSAAGTALRLFRPTADLKYPPADPKLVDPENRLYWRASPRRLEAEAIRDALLAVAGRLDRQIGGAPLTLKSINLSIEDLERHQTFYDESNRRTIYLPVLRTNVYDFLTLFDFANPDLPTGSRTTTTVPTQALLMMNSPLVIDCSRRVAESVLSRSDTSTDSERLRSLYETLYARRPRDGEVRLAIAFLDEYVAAIQPDAAITDPRKAAWAALCQTLIASNDFIYLR